MLLHPESPSCVHPNNVPPLKELHIILDIAEKIDRNDVKFHLSDKCPVEYDILLVPFAGEHYLLCISSDRKSIHSASGSHFHVTFKEVDDNMGDLPDIQHCTPTTRLPKLAPLMRPEDSWWHAQHKLGATSSGRMCVFIHGSGLNLDIPWTPMFTDYWGEIHILGITPQCTVRKFIHMDTLDYGWNYKPNQKKVCDLVLSSTRAGFFNATNTTVFTHSMGALVFAAAQLNHYCYLGEGSSWYAAAPPTEGSQVASFLDEICANEKWRTIISVASNLCNGAKPSASYDTLATNFPGLSLLHTVVSTVAKGEMCGTSAYGLNSVDSAGLALVAEISSLPAPNDGLVTEDSCNVGRPFGGAPTANYYRADINHADATCRNGDGWWGIERKPCSWYTGKI